jgi:hypothetical protein
MSNSVNKVRLHSDNHIVYTVDLGVGTPPQKRTVVFDTGLLDPSTKAFKQRCGTYFYYNRAAIGLACAQAAMRIDIAPHKHAQKTPSPRPRPPPLPHPFTRPPPRLATPD